MEWQETCVFADNNWGLAWGLGNGAQNVTPQMQAHIVELLCTPRQPCEMAAFKAAKATAQKLQFALECDVPQGAPVTAVGSPFGVISPPHFVNSVFHGVISNQWPCNKSEGASGRPDLLMADIRCLPGMEGAPVFDQQGRVVAMMLVPLWSKTFKAEVHAAILATCAKQLLHLMFLKSVVCHICANCELSGFGSCC